MKKQVHILYHYPCPDGAYAMLAAFLYFSKQHPDIECHFHPHQTTHPLRESITGAFAVYLLDYCGAPGLISTLAQTNTTVILIDHHKTAAEMLDEWRAAGKLPENLQVTMDMNHSGAMLAWQYFNQLAPLMPESDEKTCLERVYAMVEDVDLWRFRVAGSKEFSAGLAELHIELDINKNPDLPNQLLLTDPLAVERLITAGREQIRLNQQIIDKIISTAFEIELPHGGGRGLAVISNKGTNLRSELGNQLASKAAARGLRAFGCVCYTEGVPAGHIKVSMRSVGDVDVSAVARALQGGGHKNASACVVRQEVLESWRR